MLITHEPDVAARAGPHRSVHDGQSSTARSPHDLARDPAHRLGRVGSHRLRSALTMLGILIGIAAVILTVGLGQGAQAEVRDQISALGTNLLVVSPGQHHRRPACAAASARPRP